MAGTELPLYLNVDGAFFEHYFLDIQLALFLKLGMFDSGRPQSSQESPVTTKRTVVTSYGLPCNFLTRSL